MRISRVAALSIVILVSICLVFAVSCGGNGGSNGSTEGALPVLKVGDTWTQKVTVDGEQHTFVTRVTGEEVFQGIDCYIVELSVTPPLFGASNLSAKIDKSTMNSLTENGSGQISGISYSMNMTLSYKYSSQPYPLSAGKTWVVTKNMTTISTYMGKTETESETEIRTFEIEKVETITVPAGTFKCFKIIEYDETHSVVSTRWVADAVKHFEVKEIDSEPDMEFELTAYSVSK